MLVAETLVARLTTLLRVHFEIDTSTVTDESALGARPIGFTALTITTDFRVQVNRWFRDFIEAQSTVNWDETTTLADVVRALLKHSAVEHIEKAAVYRAHVTKWAGTALDDAAGAGASGVPVADRPRVRDVMNTALESGLLRKISLDTLAGGRQTILANVVDRMVT